MLFDRLVQQRLGNRRIIHLAVPMPPVANQINHYIAAKRITIFQGHTANTDNRIHILSVDVKDWN